MPTTPRWSAARSGLPGDLNAANLAAQMGQELGTHAVEIIYGGNAIITPNGSDFFWSASGTTNDHDQPFTMPTGQTTVGRVTLPILATGNAADLTVSLCPDDGSGHPVTTNPLASTVVPASWFVNLSSAENVGDAGVQLTETPLATPDFNGSGLSPRTVKNWNTPAIGPNGAGEWATPVTSGNYGVLLGGFDNTTSTAQAAVASFEYLGEQTVAQPVLQPSLPQAVYFAGATATTTSLVVAGGLVNTTTTTDAVWTASWDPSTGSVGSWSKQTSLPTTVGEAVMASYGDTVYLVGGYDHISGTVLGTVYTATVSNGQISNWTTTPPLPGPALYEQLVAVVGNRLIIAGGRTFSVATHTACYFADIAADGSLGPWQSGPSLPVGLNGLSPGWGVATTDTAMVLIGGGLVSGFTDAVQILETSPTGGLGTWQQQTFFFADPWQVFAFPEDTSDWTAIVISGPSGYDAMEIVKVPTMSVPLYATSLTPGAKYHVLLHQNGGDTDNCLQFGLLHAALPDGFLFRPAYTSGTWSTDAPNATNLTVYDASATGPHPGMWLHTWEDPVNGMASRVMTTVMDQRDYPLGTCSGTLFPNGALNVNPTFTSGVSHWVATNGTLTQSSAHTQGGFPFSGLLTPTGGFSQAYAASEQIRVPGNTHCTVDGWLYSTSGWASVSLSVNWFDSTGTYLDTSFNVVSLTAATWTHLTNVFQAPAGAAFASIVPTESGTPGATNLLYLSNLTLSFTDQAVFPSVITVDYDPATSLANGTTQLV